MAEYLNDLNYKGKYTIHRPWESLGSTRRGYRKTSLFYTNIIRKCSS